jgi:protein-S-isoprenylcysteine O-methyltransferase Ste14
LIAQSVDSRNHILVAGGVAAGLIASYFQFTLLDQIVGITVAVLILKGAFELLIDLIRTKDNEKIDFSKYGFSLYDRYRRRQMIRWFLFEIEKGRITTREEMIREARVATDYQQIASFKALGLDKKSEPEEKLEEAIQEIFDKGLAVEKNTEQENDSPQQRLLLQLTPAGEEELNRALSSIWSSPGHFPSFPGGGLLGLLASSLRFLVTVVVFIVTYALVRWVLEFLPSLDIWETGTFLNPGYKPDKLAETAGSWLLPVLDFLKTLLLSRTYMVGSYSLSGAQGLCVLLGVLFLNRGRVLLHQARHVIHHARENDVDRPFYLITDGLFSLRRHPMYAGLILINLGIGIGLHSVYTLAWAAVAIIFRLVSALVEEGKLMEWFGREYKNYKAQVKKRFFSWWGWLFIIIIYTFAWFGM